MDKPNINTKKILWGVKQLISEYNEYYRIVPDTSIIIQENLLEILDKENIENPEIIISQATIAELEHQANNNENKGFKGLNYLKELQELVEDNYLNLHIEGKRPNPHDIKYADKGEIDALIRDLAADENAILITSDKVQAETAKAQGIAVIYHKQQYAQKELKIMKFFNKNTLSMHIKL